MEYVEELLRQKKRKSDNMKRLSQLDNKSIGDFSGLKSSSRDYDKTYGDTVMEVSR